MPPPFVHVKLLTIGTEIVDTVAFGRVAFALQYPHEDAGTPNTSIVAIALIAAARQVCLASRFISSPALL